MKYMRNIVLCSVSAAVVCTSPYVPAADDAANGILPQSVVDRLTQQHTLPRYEESWYHVLGRSPVVDAVLSDPMYLPTYVRDVSAQLREEVAMEDANTGVLFSITCRGGGVASVPNAIMGLGPAPRDVFMAALGEEGGQKLELVWGLFVHAHDRAETALSGLDEDDRNWLIAHPDAWFFGNPETDLSTNDADDAETTLSVKKSEEYNFFTIEDTSVQQHIFEMSTRVDFAQLAEATRELGLLSDIVRANADLFTNYKGTFIYEDDATGLTMLLSGTDNDRHTESYDFILDVGGNDTYLNNAGGTGLGERVAAVCIDLQGNDRYETHAGSLGSGFLGIGALVDFEGDDIYSSTTITQGAAYFGCGLFADLNGSDEYRAEYFAQSAAAFGVSMFWDAGSGDDYYIADGMAQAAASTMGVAFLIESGGNDRYRCGGPRDSFWSKRMGIGQGGAAGVRSYPWKEAPSFYGGVAFLDDAGGDDMFESPVFSQGGSYFLSLGVLNNTGGDDRYIASADAQGSTIHLTAGCLIDDGGNDYYDGGWGSTGIGGDRSVGILIDTMGNDTYVGSSHNIGSARKPKAVGIFIDVAGDDTYLFDGDECCAHVQQPSDPEDWPTATFLDLGGVDQYPDASDGIIRDNDRTWSFGPTGYGADITLDVADQKRVTDELFALFSRQPRIPFSTLKGWGSNVAFRPFPSDLSSIDDDTIGFWVEQLSASKDYDIRRRWYEIFDTIYFLKQRDGADTEASNIISMYATLIADPAAMAVDQIAFAATWIALNPLSIEYDTMIAAAQQWDTIESPLGRKYYLRMVGAYAVATAHDTTELATVLSAALSQDLDAECRRIATLYLAQLGTNEALSQLLPALKDSSSMVRRSACQGLRDSNMVDAKSKVTPLLDDPDLYVQRAAALCLISLGDSAGVRTLLTSMHVKTLDTGENYGHNLYAELADYLGIELLDELGLDLDRWEAWWDANEDTFDLDAALDARQLRQKE